MEKLSLGPTCSCESPMRLRVKCLRPSGERWLPVVKQRTQGDIGGGYFTPHEEAVPTHVDEAPSAQFPYGRWAPLVWEGPQRAMFARRSNAKSR